MYDKYNREIIDKYFRELNQVVSWKEMQEAADMRAGKISNGYFMKIYLNEISRMNRRIDKYGGPDGKKNPALAAKNRIVINERIEGIVNNILIFAIDNKEITGGGRRRTRRRRKAGRRSIKHAIKKSGKRKRSRTHRRR